MKPYYDQGGIQIFHANALDVLPTLDAAAVDLVLTDPPYGLGDRMQGGTWGRTYKEAMRWDAFTLDDLVLRLTSIGKHSIIWGGNYYPLPPSRGWLCWYKPDSVRTMASVELAWTSLDKNARHITHAIAATNGERVGHPTQKPLRVMRWSIQYADLTPNSLILDPFLGSGTTLQAAKECGYRAIGIEIEERYCEIAAKRLAQNVLPLFEVAPC